MKKLIALVLALALVLASCAVAFADTPTYSITVHNTNEHISINGKKYTAYKLFDSTHSGENYSYTLSTSSPFYSADLVGTTEPDAATKEMANVLWNAFTFTPMTGDTTKVNVVAKSGFNARAFADAMQEFLSGITASGYKFESAEAASETATITVNGNGYYFVIGNADPANPRSTEGVVSAVILTNENPSPSINPKADAPTLDKKITGDHTLDDAGKAATAQVGSTVNFELDSVVPDLTGYSDYIFTISDTMSAGLSFTGTDTANEINGLVVKINNETLVLNGAGENSVKKYTIAHEVRTKTFSVTIPYATLAHYAKGNAIVVTYSATVNEGALTTDYEKNTAKLTYSHSPYDDTTNDTPDKTVYVIDVNIDVEKVVKDNTGTKLKDAEFKLFKGSSLPADTDLAWYKYNATSKSVTWVAKADSDTFKTVETTGKLDHQFQGLEIDKSTGSTYGLLETKAPTGYNQLLDPIYITLMAGINGENSTITLSKSDTTTATLSKTSIDLTHAASSQPVATSMVENSSGTVLPSTGGIGTTIFYVLGGLLVVGAAVILVARRKAHD